MTKQEKNQVLGELTEKFANSNYFYVTDASSLTVEKINKLRRMCFEKSIEFKVAKNTLVKKALQANGDQYEELFTALHGPTAIMFTDTANLPAKLIKEFRADKDKPALKGAYIDSSIYLGEESLEALATLKSKDELLGEIIGLLQSPVTNVMSALQGSAGHKIAGIVKALEEKAN